MRLQFIEDHRERFPVTRMCDLLGVSRSGYYAWRGRPPSAREMANRELYRKIKAVYDEIRQVYGSPRIYHALKGRGVPSSENRGARLMKLHGLKAKQEKTFKVTTRRNKTHQVAPNLLGRSFAAGRPNEIWLTDITYISTEEGWLYLAVVMDLYSRRIVGWAMSDRINGDLTIRAVKMALTQREVGPGLIHHSDQGSQYADGEYRQLLKDWGIEASMNGVGSWYDNAPAESFFATLRTEQAHHRAYPTRAEARAESSSTSRLSTTGGGSIPPSAMSALCTSRCSTIKVLSFTNYLSTEPGEPQV